MRRQRGSMGGKVAHTNILTLLVFLLFGKTLYKNFTETIVEDISVRYNKNHLWGIFPAPANVSEW